MCIYLGGARIVVGSALREAQWSGLWGYSVQTQCDAPGARGRLEGSEVGTMGVLGLGESAHCSGLWIQVLRPDRWTDGSEGPGERESQPSAAQCPQDPSPSQSTEQPCPGQVVGDREVGSRGEEGQAGPGAWQTGCGTRWGGGCLSSLV